MRASILILILCAGSGFTVAAQSPGQHVIAPAGDVDHNDRIQLTWTIGEVATSGRTQIRQSITEGFHQPVICVENMAGKTIQPAAMPAVEVFPNPASDALQVQFDQPITVAWQLMLSNADGTPLSSTLQPRGSTAATLNLSSLPAGMYILLLKSEDNAQQLQYRISKIQ